MNTISKKYFILILALLTPVCFLVAETFIVEKPKRSISPKKQQDRCCTSCADVSESICALIGTLNSTLQILLLDVRQFIEGCKDARLERATKEQLAHLNTLIKNFDRDSQALQQKANEISAYLQKI